MEEITSLPEQMVDLPIKTPIRIKEGISIINENPLGVLEKYGKYEFIYDYKVPSAWEKVLASSMVTLKGFGESLVPTNLVKEGSSNANMIAPSGYWSGQTLPQPVKVNSEPQVGTFSKGNIVNVLRFDGYNAIIQNPNFVEPDPNAPKTLDFGFDLKKTKEFSIPKDYLRKADDTLAVTVSTGILYGANMKPQPVFYNDFPYIKPILTTPVNQTILEENASFVLARDFNYRENIYCAPNERCIPPPTKTIISGSKVTGTLVRETNNTLYKLQAGAITPPNYNDYLAVKGYGSQGSINIPIEYLTKEVPTQSGVVLPVEDNNKNLLMIVGAFLLGYVLFGKDTPTT
jgi:hypothetical protein